STIESRVNSIVRNRIFDGLGDGMVLKYVNSYVAENIIDGQDKSVGQIGIYVDNSRYTPTSFRIERNIVDDCRHGVYVLVPSSAISLSSNYKI
ncbi:MAG TPA: right-handed parallel beta-helix repeat-containing protein, partial [Methanoregulaceae archaeon]|nr:right-handed parallel beta-helix repeat-containing protein [Methanoregulaceae archaeon]